MLIITPSEFLDAANRLAEFRKINDGLEVAVVTTHQVYNEFSSGRQDVSAIRDFIKLLYDRDKTASKFRYVLLFGDASYNYKSPEKNHHVPTYQSRNSCTIS